MNTAIIVLVLAAGLYWLFARGKTRPGKAAEPGQLGAQNFSHQAANEEHPYQSASLCSLGCGCPEVEALAQRRFLVGEVPPLPLPECTSDHCNCKYVEHNDRRYDGNGRSLPTEADTSLLKVSGSVERRKLAARGRRKTDRAA